MDIQLLNQSCIDCTKDTPPLESTAIEAYLTSIDNTWNLSQATIQRTVLFDNYLAGLYYMTYIAAIAQQQGHHPDLLLSWNKVTITLTTHSIKQLTVNDFIIAAHCDNALTIALFNVVVSGTVQGVFYRKYCQKKALSLNLTGFVKNNSDKTVSVTVQGPIFLCHELIKWCYIGSPNSSVNAVDYKLMHSKQQYTTFLIK